LQAGGTVDEHEAGVGGGEIVPEGVGKRTGKANDRASLVATAAAEA